MLVVRLSFFWGWRMATFQLSGFYCARTERAASARIAETTHRKVVTWSEPSTYTFSCQEADRLSGMVCHSRKGMGSKFLFDRTDSENLSCWRRRQRQYATCYATQAAVGWVETDRKLHVCLYAAPNNLWYCDDAQLHEVLTFNPWLEGQRVYRDSEPHPGCQPSRFLNLAREPSQMPNSSMLKYLRFLPLKGGLNVGVILPWQVDLITAPASRVRQVRSSRNFSQRACAQTACWQAQTYLQAGTCGCCGC